MLLWRPLVVVGSKGNSQPFLLPPSSPQPGDSAGLSSINLTLSFFKFLIYFLFIYFEILDFTKGHLTKSSSNQRQKE